MSIHILLENVKSVETWWYLIIYMNMNMNMNTWNTLEISANTLFGYFYWVTTQYLLMDEAIDKIRSHTWGDRFPMFLSTFHHHACLQPFWLSAWTQTTTMQFQVSSVTIYIWGHVFDRHVPGASHKISLLNASNFFSYMLSREYRVVRYRYSRLLFISEDRLCTNLCMQWH